MVSRAVFIQKRWADTFKVRPVQRLARQISLDGGNFLTLSPFAMLAAAKLRSVSVMVADTGPCKSGGGGGRIIMGHFFWAQKWFLLYNFHAYWESIIAVAPLRWTRGAWLFRHATKWGTYHIFETSSSMAKPNFKIFSFQSFFVGPRTLLYGVFGVFVH